MPGPVLQMALLAQPIVKRKSHVLPSGPGVAINEPQLHLPPAHSHASEEDVLGGGGAGASDIRSR